MPETAQRQRSARPGLLALALCAAAATAGWLWRDELGAIFSGGDDQSGSRSRMSLVETTPVAQRRVEQRIAATGTLLASETVTVTARTRGRVEAVRFNEGDAVATGEPLVVLERTRAQARVREAKAQRTETRSDLERLRTLRGEQFVSESRLEQAAAAAESAAAGLTLAEADLDDRVIAAPFAGVVGRRLVSPGALLEPGTPVADLRRNDPIDLLFDVPEAAIGPIERGQRVRASTPALPEQTFDGKLTLVGTALNTNTRTLPLEATFGNQRGLLKPGMFMQVTVITGERELLSVPEAAVIARGPTQHVFALERGASSPGTKASPGANPGAGEDPSAQKGKQSAAGATAIARRRAVKTGIRRDGWVEIRSGLQADDRVVVAGLQGLRDGAKVRVKPAGKAAEKHGRQGASGSPTQGRGSSDRPTEARSGGSPDQ
jgi:membrane fusion protein (multidrug efflux system)